MSMPIRVGQGFDVHVLCEGRPLILGGVTIPHTHGLMGHSDADALLHAITDAILGAAGLGYAVAITLYCQTVALWIYLWRSPRFADLGLSKVRLTGGEPTVRKDFTDLVAAVAACDGVNKTKYVDLSKRYSNLERVRGKSVFD